MKICLNTPVALTLVLVSLGTTVVQQTRASAFITNNPMASPRYIHSATLLTNGCVLVVGGYANWLNKFLTNSELFNPATGTWSNAGTLPPVGTYPNAHMAHTATLLTNGTVLVAGGMDGFNLFSQTELFSPASLSWAFTGGLNIPRAFHTATLLTNGMVLVAGGVDSTNAALASAELYDPASGTWAMTGVMTSTRKYHTAALLTNGMVLVTGGEDRFGNMLGSAELFDPASGTWTATGTMTKTREYHTATLLTNGQVLVVGGNGGLVASTNSELFNPTTGKWTATAALNFSHYHHTATLLTNGQVLIVGGNLANGTAELYNPANNGTWLVSSSLNTIRCFHTTTLLPNGQALITGGAFTVVAPSYNSGATGYSSTEIYDASLKASATVTITNLIQTFDGRAKSVSVATMPTNLPVNLIYNGSPDAPTNVGNYTVIGTINDPNYQGGATNTLAIVPPAFNTQTSVGTGAFTVFFTNASGVSFSVLETTNLSIPFSEWNELGTAIEIMPGQYQFSDPQMTNGGQRFYRIRWR
jgi:hypothetical protein